MSGLLGGVAASGSEEAVADAVEGFDVAGVGGVITQSPAQRVDMPRDGVVLSERGVRPPEGARDLAIRDPGAGPRGERVKDRVLARRQPDLARPLTDAPAESVDLEVRDPERCDLLTGRRRGQRHARSIDRSLWIRITESSFPRRRANSPQSRPRITFATARRS